MYRICVFAGTAEGRKLVEFLIRQPVDVTACVATQYGETLLPSSDNLTVSAKRLAGDEITKLFSENSFDVVIDATHPYAQSVTENILDACRMTGTEYIRLLRGESVVSSGIADVADTESAVEFLKGTKGNILLTTGSKELAKFAVLPGFEDRVYARVLPLETSLSSCHDAGMKLSHIIAMQGPFSEEMNLALLRSTGASWLVTKDGGEQGGFEAKISAAEKAGVNVLVIGRPPQTEGISYFEAVEKLCSRFGCTYKPRVDIVGIGPGNAGSMTEDARRAIENADCLIGAKRMLEAVASPSQPVYDAISPSDIAGFIMNHSEYRDFTVVMSGDTGFFSGTKKLLPLLEGCEVNVTSGLSSLVYLCSRLKTSYEDVFVVSTHGRNHNIVPDVRSHERVFALVGSENGMRDLCRTLTDAGLGNVRINAGERLSYPDEKIICDTARNLTDVTFDTLSVALIENDNPDYVVTHGLPDNVFIRGAGDDGVVPMTKSEVRSVCLSKLRLTERSVCWDVGAGTGSVAVEMALQAKKGSVYAIERKSSATELLYINKEKLSAENLVVVNGYAPEACLDLPAPTHAFIGGSSGNMKEILALLLSKNPSVRIVATAIALESVAELTACMKEFPWAETEVISMQVAYGRQAGSYNLMTGQNPIYIFTMQAGGNEQ